MLQIAMDKNCNYTSRKPIDELGDGAEVWQKKGTVNRLFYALNNDLFCDVHFLFGSKEESSIIPAHSLILSVSSRVFQNLFNKAWVLKNDNVHQIIIKDIKPEIFRAVLKYLYTEELVKDYKTVISMLNPAKKYELADLTAECEKFLMESVSFNTASELLVVARSFELETLKERCLSTFDTNKQTFRSEKFTDLDLDLVSNILKRDTLMVSERDLFEAALRWAIAECKRQNFATTPKNKRKILWKLFSGGLCESCGSTGSLAK